MSDPLLPVAVGHTELTEDDRVGLIPSHITTRCDLFEAEQLNIDRALRRADAGEIDELLVFARS